ncbi:hypothetical protein Trydic_g614 [Trypoxylus dichotomus]
MTDVENVRRAIDNAIGHVRVFNYGITKRCPPMMIADIARGRRRLDGAPLGKSARRRTSTVTGIARKTILCDEGRKRWAARRRLRCRSDVAKSVLAVRRDDGDRAHCTVASDDPVPSYIYPVRARWFSSNARATCPFLRSGNVPLNGDFVRVPIHPSLDRRPDAADSRRRDVLATISFRRWKRDALILPNARPVRRCALSHRSRRLYGGDAASSDVINGVDTTTRHRRRPSAASSKRSLRTRAGPSPVERTLR